MLNWNTFVFPIPASTGHTALRLPDKVLVANGLCANHQVDTAMIAPNLTLGCLGFWFQYCCGGVSVVEQVAVV